MEMLKKLPDKSIDMILTDIPYNEVNRESNWLRELDKWNADVLEIDLNELLKEFDRVCKWSIYVFCWFKQFSTIMSYFKDNWFSDRCIVWEKTNPSPMNAKTLWVSWVELCAFWKRKKVNATYNWWYQNTVLKYPVSRKIWHTTPKNLNMFKYLIEKSSNPWDIILDPFVWSWTTAIAAKETERKYIVSDLDENNIELTNKRISWDI
jgi:DNA modification methylase